MKLIDVKELHEPFDCASGMGEGLLATGNFKVYTPPEKPKPKQQLTWKVHEGARIQQVWDAPFITFHCKTCGNGGTMSGPTCHKTQTVRCCGTFSKVPDDIAKEYAAFRKEWEPKHKRYLDMIRRHEEEQETSRRLSIEQENRLLARKFGTSQQ